MVAVGVVVVVVMYGIGVKSAGCCVVGDQDYSYDVLMSPSACLLRFLKLPEDCCKLVSLKDTAVILMAYLEQMTHSYVYCHGLYKVRLSPSVMVTRALL